MTEHLRVVHIDGPVDYRSTGRPGASRFAAGSWTLGANLGARRFDELCDMPRSTGHYLAMTESIDEFAISGIPALADAGADAVQRFCNLVDVLYDRDIRTAFYSCVDLRSAAQGCAGLDIDRIVSRLSDLRDSPDPGN
ncbi:MAG: AFG1/ZapE family ATPase [Rhodococcus sp. (in: high G+C Gram-positive bacteria)]